MESKTEQVPVLSGNPTMAPFVSSEISKSLVRYVALLIASGLLLTVVMWRTPHATEHFASEVPPAKSKPESPLQPGSTRSESDAVSPQPPPRPCPRGQYPANGTRICTSWRQLVDDQHMYAVDANGAKYSVCLPPKNGSTVHQGLIFRILGFEKYDAKHNVHFNQEGRVHMVVDNFTDEKIADLMEGDFPRYAIIRNPMERTLSGYMTSRGRRLGSDVDLRTDFRNWVVTSLVPQSKDWRRSNQHTRGQLEFCGFRTAGIRHKYQLFRFEEPEKYADYLYGIVPREFLDDGWGQDHNVSFREYVVGPRKQSHDTDEIFWRFVGNMKTFDLIAESVKEDIEFFGYSDAVKEMRSKFQKLLKAGFEL